MIKVELIKDCVYHASSYVFDYRKENTKVQEVSNKVGKVLLDSGYFQEIKEDVKEEVDPNKKPEQPEDPEKTQQTDGDNTPPNNDGQSEG